MTIKLGFVGLGAGHSWASQAHLTGLRLVKDSPYKITGVSTSSEESAKASVEKNELKDAKAYASIDALLEAKNVDTVVVSVKVPHHYELVSKALTAGKDVFCEWPLGNGLAEAEKLVALALEKGVKTAVGFQARKSPTLIKAKELIDSGAIGRVISTNFKAHIDTWGQFLRQSLAEYLQYKKNGADMLSIPSGHDLDAIAFVLGEFEWLNGYLSTQFTDVDTVSSSESGKTERTGKVLHRDIDDQILVQGKLLSGATASIHMRGQEASDITKGEGLRWEIHGSKGDILITSPFAMGQLSLLSIKMSQLDEDGNPTGLVDLSQPYDPIAGNYTEFYESYAKTESGAPVPPQLQNVEGFPTFEDALIRHRQIQAIIDSSESGSRKSYL